MDNYDDSPFKVACRNHGREEATQAIENALNDCPDGEHPYDAAQALLSAAVDQSVDLDCVYFILRREPDVMSRLLSAKGAVLSRSNSDNGNDGGGAARRESECQRKSSK